MTKYKLALFDMDGTLLNGRTIFYFADTLGFRSELVDVLRRKIQPFEKSILIGRFLKGYSPEELLDIYKKIPIQRDAKEIINKLRKNDIYIAIVTDSYNFVADDLKKRLKADLAFANELVYKNGRFTGEVNIHNCLKKQDFIDNKVYSICKSCILEMLCTSLSIKTRDALAIGDGNVDRSMIQKAGLGIAFNASDEVNKYADICTKTMIDILKYI